MAHLPEDPPPRRLWWEVDWTPSLLLAVPNTMDSSHKERMLECCFEKVGVRLPSVDNEVHVQARDSWLNGCVCFFCIEYFLQFRQRYF